MHDEEIVDAAPPDPDELLRTDVRVAAANAAARRSTPIEDTDSPRQPAEPPASTDAAPAAPSPRIQKPQIHCVTCLETKPRKGSKKGETGMLCADCLAAPAADRDRPLVSCLECGVSHPDNGSDFCSVVCRLAFEKAEKEEAGA